MEAAQAHMSLLCQNATLMEIMCHGSYNKSSGMPDGLYGEPVLILLLTMAVLPQPFSPTNTTGLPTCLLV